MKGLTSSAGKGPSFQVATGDAGDGSKMTRARSHKRGRKPREQDTGASNTTAGSSFIRPQAEMRLLEVILGRDNMMAALRREVANKGAPGIDGMSVDDLSRHLKAQLPLIKEDSLVGRCRPSAVRRVEIPKPGGGMRLLGIPPVLDRLIQRCIWR